MPGWLYFVVGGAAGAFVVTAILFWIDVYHHSACTACGGSLICPFCGEWPHHEFQGVAQGQPRGLQGVRSVK